MTNGTTASPAGAASVRSNDEAVRAAYKHIDRKRRIPWQGEEEVRLAWVAALEAATGFDFDAERQKRDSNYNNVIIEFKAPGLFKGSATNAKFAEAMRDRLHPYIQKAAKQTGIPESDFIGIAIDGEHICFAQVLKGKIEHNHLLPFSEQSLGMVVAACQSSTRRAVSSENLIKDFGHASSVATDVMQVLADSLADALGTGSVSKVKMLFEEWKELYGQVADISDDQQESIDEALRFVWNGPVHLSMAARLFVIHTYNSLLIKLLAAEIVAAHHLTTKRAPAEEMCALLSQSDLLKVLDVDIERGGLFSGSGITGFVEEAIFSWHLDAAKSPKYQARMASGLKSLLGKLALYRTDRLERQRDTLRDFYQDLVPQSLRRSLGEFYTPDWLVDFAVSKVASGDILGRRFLDPTCGSGSFLIEIIRRKRAAAIGAKLAPRELLTVLCSEVWGFDLNPLAVQTSRVNFLMEIADLLEQAQGFEVELPVLLADAIYSPAADPSGKDDIVEYRIGSEFAGLVITLPSELAFNRLRLDKVFEAMGDHIDKNREFDAVLATLLATKTVVKAEARAWDAPLRATYEQVLNLHRKNWNGIWFRIVRNFFWSATAGTFDVVVGNPPWVRWSRLPDAYRERVKPTCQQYDIFSKTGHHGGNELDISAMITYTTADKWLKKGGKLAFVITQTLFQNPSSAGFRNFRINPTSNLVPLGVDDLKALKPFPDAANKTAVVVFRKSSKEPVYPVAYRVWDAKSNHTRTISPDLDLVDVLKKIENKLAEANPVDGDGSPWAVLPPGRFKQLLPMSRPTSSPWAEGRKGITVDLNGVYFIRVLASNKTDNLVQIQTRPEAGKKKIGAAQTRWIEPTMLYPLVKGASDFKPCYLEPVEELYAIVPNTGIRKADYTAAASTYAAMPKMRKFFSGYADLLEQRSTWKTRMAATGAPSYAIYNVGDFTFKPWKVIWAEMSGRFSAAVAGSANVPLMGMRPYVPDHKIFFVAMDNKAEAFYLCGLLNTKTVAEYVESHNVAIQVGDIFKHMRLPEFNASNKKHTALAELVESAHSESDGKTRDKIVDKVRVAGDALMTTWLASNP